MLQQYCNLHALLCDPLVPLSRQFPQPRVRSTQHAARITAASDQELLITMAPLPGTPDQLGELASLDFQAAIGAVVNLIGSEVIPPLPASELPVRPLRARALEPARRISPIS